jgi:hypothetical protein
VTPPAPTEASGTSENATGADINAKLSAENQKFAAAGAACKDAAADLENATVQDQNKAFNDCCTKQLGLPGVYTAGETKCVYAS